MSASRDLLQEPPLEAEASADMEPPVWHAKHIESISIRYKHWIHYGYGVHAPDAVQKPASKMVLLSRLLTNCRVSLVD